VDKVKGVLEVGTNGAGEGVINHPDLEPDENGVGHIVFSPNQARNLANLLIWHATEAEGGGTSKTATVRNSCNRHDDCKAADEAYVARHGERPGWNFHCHDEECDECFGN
jgi:hypothetical protein